MISSLMLIFDTERVSLSPRSFIVTYSSFFNHFFYLGWWFPVSYKFPMKLSTKIYTQILLQFLGSKSPHRSSNFVRRSAIQVFSHFLFPVSHSDWIYDMRKKAIAFSMDPFIHPQSYPFHLHPPYLSHPPSTLPFSLPSMFIFWPPPPKIFSFPFHLTFYPLLLSDSFPLTPVP